MLTRPALALVNHVLVAEGWARDRLAGVAGQTASVEFGNSTWVVRISEAGLLEAVDAQSPATVSIRLPDDAPLRVLTDRRSLFSSVTISGSADLAETLGFVFRNLRWDVEHDLSQLLGDVVARRAFQAAKILGRWQGPRNLARAAAEYFGEEESVLARRREIRSFCSQVDVLREDLSHFEKKLERAEVRERAELR